LRALTYNQKTRYQYVYVQAAFLLQDPFATIDTVYFLLMRLSMKPLIKSPYDLLKKPEPNLLSKMIVLVSRLQHTGESLKKRSKRQFLQ
jgi:hypothetical protein